MGNDNIRDEELEQYKAALANFHYDGPMRWQVFQPFLIINTGWIIILANNLFGESPKFVFLISGGILGLIVTLFWLATYKRSLKWYYFRIYQVRKKEPTNWNLMKGDASQFASGDLAFNISTLKTLDTCKLLKAIKSKSQKKKDWTRMCRPEKWWGNTKIMYWIISIFFVLYFLLIISSLFIKTPHIDNIIIKIYQI